MSAAATATNPILVIKTMTAANTVLAVTPENSEINRMIPLFIFNLKKKIFFLI